MVLETVGRFLIVCGYTLVIISWGIDHGKG